MPGAEVRSCRTTFQARTAAAAAVALGPAHPQPLLYLGLAIALMLLGAIVVAAATDHLKLAFRLTLVTAAAVVATVVAAGVAF
jgi:hypothetical protein